MSSLTNGVRSEFIPLAPLPVRRERLGEGVRQHIDSEITIVNGLPSGVLTQPLPAYRERSRKRIDCAVTCKQLDATLILLWAITACIMLTGCGRKPITRESQLSLSNQQTAVWAIAPAVNLTGQDNIDPLLQADLLFEAVGRIKGVTAVPVNRTAEVMVATGRTELTSEADARVLAQALGVDGIIVPTITAFDPYDPPTFGASLQLFLADPVRRGKPLDVRALQNAGAAPITESLPTQVGFLQSANVFDAAEGSVRARIVRYAKGREGGLLHAKETGLQFRPLTDHGPSDEAITRVTLEMDRYCGFVYHELLSDLLDQYNTPGAP